MELQPQLLVIFGASGDLMKRKLAPALLRLAEQGLLPEKFAVLGFARTQMNDEDFRSNLEDSIKTTPKSDAWNWLRERLFYCQGNYGDCESMKRLQECLRQIDGRMKLEGNWLFYLATPPEVFDDLVIGIRESGLNKSQGWVRIVVEKPFGNDLESAQHLNRLLWTAFDEHSIYRIDHYLGKETVQNLLVLRFGNTIFEPLWNRRYVDHVQITVAESDGVGTRGRYYDLAGALRDMVPNHMFQLLTLIAMEPPISLDADAVRDEKLRVLKSIKPLEPEEIDENVVRGQYGAGEVNGQAVPAYRNEPYVNRESSTETFVAIRLFVRNWRWEGVPFYLRTGKRLPKRVTEVQIQFRPVPHLLFPPETAGQLKPNLLTLRIQPDEGIILRVETKVIGMGMQVRSTPLDFYYSQLGTPIPDAYERLLLDAMRGDQTLFMRADEVEAAWRIVTPILRHWENSPPPNFPNYSAGTWGPKEADELLERDGRKWLTQ
ncbi:MAG: glucose-6-phosphate dehydrogenase [Armatimonadetes bacterium]|nr:glucose-6-phosphate dehydrogenase [Armatimonadota bacterium]MCX7967560.1 glucose-6-phosphate dehydrogenase [Armatimonadota bacterium]MDW8143219.1 glucose-6-phosphate dehydrogenase [Armatimonadota bacterium]